MRYIHVTYAHTSCRLLCLYAINLAAFLVQHGRLERLRWTVNDVLLSVISFNHMEMKIAKHVRHII